MAQGLLLVGSKANYYGSMLLPTLFICRCPNPDACAHEASQLAEHHPYNLRSVTQVLTWNDYTRQLCDEPEGYQGVMCGVCVKGFGVTGPFKCRKCLGAQSADPSNPAKASKPPSLAGISGLYFFYWFVLTGWYVFTVWTCMPESPSASEEVKDGPSKQTHPADVPSTASLTQFKDVDAATGNTEGRTVKKCPACQCKECGCAGCAETDKEGDEAGLLDVVKVR